MDSSSANSGPDNSRQPIAQVLCEDCLVAHVAYTADELRDLQRCPICGTGIFTLLEEQK